MHRVCIVYASCEPQPPSVHAPVQHPWPIWQPLRPLLLLSVPLSSSKGLSSVMGHSTPGQSEPPTT